MSGDFYDSETLEKLGLSPKNVRVVQPESAWIDFDAAVSCLVWDWEDSPAVKFKLNGKDFAPGKIELIRIDDTIYVNLIEKGGEE